MPEHRAKYIRYLVHLEIISARPNDEIRGLLNVWYKDVLSADNNISAQIKDSLPSKAQRHTPIVSFSSNAQKPALIVTV